MSITFRFRENLRKLFWVWKLVVRSGWFRSRSDRALDILKTVLKPSLFMQILFCTYKIKIWMVDYILVISYFFSSYNNKTLFSDINFYCNTCFRELESFSGNKTILEICVIKSSVAFDGIMPKELLEIAANSRMRLWPPMRIRFKLSTVCANYKPIMRRSLWVGVTYDKNSNRTGYSFFLRALV